MQTKHASYMHTVLWGSSLVSQLTNLTSYGRMRVLLYIYIAHTYYKQNIFSNLGCVPDFLA